MCLVENAQHEKIFAYIQQRVSANKAARQLFCSSLLFCFWELNAFLEFTVRDPRIILRVPWNSKLGSRTSKIETQASKLNSWFSKTLRIENWVSSRDCQLTFEWYCMCVQYCANSNSLKQILVKRQRTKRLGSILTSSHIGFLPLQIIFAQERHLGRPVVQNHNTEKRIWPSMGKQGKRWTHGHACDDTAR